ncbi:MAG TPA: ABC transporter ATP-binding protein/permease [Steroidobacteraceae bacterium]|nr:ABC transporter ATP-binding protein/permease [Steroidobacteraceae bacterium]
MAMEPPPATTRDSDEAAASALLPQLAAMARAMFASPVARALIVLGVLTVAVVAATAYAQILLNGWNRPFYDALSRRDLHDFIHQTGVFCAIAGSLLVLNVIQRWLGETLKVKLREGLVHDLLSDWLQPRRAFWLANSGSLGENPDQRMHEDARKLCELSSDLGIGLLQATILLVSFSGVLWVLSQQFVFRVGARDYAVPGFMLWAAVLYALAGSLLSYWVGRSLVNRNAERYAREADLRIGLVRINEHLDDITLAAGEEDERRRVELQLRNVLAATRRIVMGLTNLTWVTAGFGWVTQVVPILVAAPLYFTGKISFGGLMMAAAAFTQAVSSLRWFIDNFSTIADWRATLLRVASFRQALLSLQPPQGGSRIEYAEGPDGVLLIDELRIDSSGGQDALRESHVAVHGGERVLIDAASGTGRTQLFRALAGLWPRGSGRITRPRDMHALYIPRGKPYLPRGTLRQVLAYPLDVGQFGDPTYEHALARMNLARLVPLLDTTQRWDRELDEDEQMLLPLVRMVVHAPAWVLVDGSFAALDEAALERVGEVLDNELKHTAVIHIGRPSQANDAIFSRALHLVRVSAAAPAPLAAGAHSQAPAGGRP